MELMRSSINESKQAMEGLKDDMRIAQADSITRLGDAVSELKHAQNESATELKSLVASVREEAKRYTDDCCARVMHEVEEEVEHVKEEVDQVKKEVDKTREEASREREEIRRWCKGFEHKVTREVDSIAVALYNAQLQTGAAGFGGVCGERDGNADRRSLSADLDGRHRGGCYGIEGSRDGINSVASLPLSPPTTPPATPPGSPYRGDARRRKPQEFDGRVSLEAYLAQFELLAQAQGWNKLEMAVQLVSCLKGPAVEVLSQMTSAQRTSYSQVVAALERRYGHQHQAEVFRARFRARIRARGETLQQLAHELENLVHKAYPGASEDLLVVLLRDQFVDALEDPQLKIYVKQAHVANLQEALARALEFESFVKTSSGRNSFDVERRAVRARKGKVRWPEKTAWEKFNGLCWTCSRKGHMRRDCPEARRSRSWDRGQQYVYKPCCWNCGEMGHLSSACQKTKIGQVEAAGNDSWRNGGAQDQPAQRRPRSR